MKEVLSYKKKLKLLRNLLKKRDCNYYLLPRTDKFQNEFISEEDERVKWLTGFSGSFAFVIISLKQNIIFTDGRYIDQIKKEVDQKTFKILDINNKEPILWLKDKIQAKEKVLLDSWLFSCNKFNYLKKIVKEKKSKILLSKEILIDKIWKKKPNKTINKIFIRETKYSGIFFKNKIQHVKKILKDKKINSFFFSSPESISWLLNIRSNQIKYTPIVLSFLLLNLNEKSYFFAKKNKNLKKYFSSYFIIFDLQDLREILINFSITNKEIYLDPNKTPYFIENFFKTIGVKVKYSQDPCENLKLIKNPIEIKGFKSSHIRDGVSVCKFLFWLDEIIKKNKKVSEIITSKKLFEFRKKNKLFRGLSFETISSFGSNGSIIHYRVSTKTNKILKKNNLYLYDSGAQYLDGTTDMTRTICIGDNPTQEQKDRFTRVLKGNLGLSNYSFSDRTTGSVLDKIARRHLKEKKLDYPHGTGHGVGSYLSVHEGPISISKSSKTKFKKGMVLTNEPGFYKTNQYGIRIENIMLVIKKKKLLGFEILTLVPIDIKLIDTKLLNIQEKNWLNIYHKKVFNKIFKYLNKKERKWLKEKTAPI